MTQPSESQDLRRQADETDQLAATVSYAPDKARLTELARHLRTRAVAAEARAFDRKTPRK